MRNDLKDKLRTESNFKFVLAACLVLGLIGTLIFAPHGKDFYLEAEEDVKTMMQICQNSAAWAKANRSKLKLGKQSRLTNIKVNGEIPTLKHAKTPEVIFLASGYETPNSVNDIACEITNPATKKKFYYIYDDQRWTDRVRFRR